MNLLPHETPSQQHYLHEYTYPELLTTDDVVIDWAGIMWAGPHRRGMNAVAPTDLWKAWQKAVQKATARVQQSAESRRAARGRSQCSEAY